MILIRKFCKALLQHLPDFKGIETAALKWAYMVLACSTSLTSKGLRHLAFFTNKCNIPCSTSLTSKGLRRSETTCYHFAVLAAPPWLQRDWDCFQILTIFASLLAAPPWLQRDWDLAHGWLNQCAYLQHLPDFKGIETQKDLQNITVSACSTSLTSKGLRRVIFFSLQEVNLAAPPWLQRDWD